MKNSIVLKGAIAAATAMLPLSQAVAEVNISGWINEGITYADDGVNSTTYQTSENGHTLGSRITFSGSSEVSTGLNAGFEVIIEPQATSELLGSGSSASTGALFNNEQVGGPAGHGLIVLGNSLNISGSFGKVTVGLQSMPTDNIAVLEDPSLTLWASISPVFVGNGAAITGTTGTGAGATWGGFLQCGSGLGIGIDCNGIYRKGIRYDLPAFGPVSVAVGISNDDVYDISAKYKGSLGRLNAQLALGYAMLNGATLATRGETDNFQMQAGLMDPVTGLFGSIAYQNEDFDSAAAGLADDTDAWWFKGGIKKQWLSVGNTSISMQYGQYHDQYTDVALTGSEVERLGFEVNQYFGSSLIIYGVYEQLDLDVDGDTLGAYAGANELDTFRMGATYFF